MFIHNAWYVIAEPQEIPRGTALARTVLGTKIVLYRTESGQPVAFIDACPHRHAPLSKGKIEGNCIRCPYHGSVYDETGRCVSVPGQRSSHGMNVALTRHPIIESYNYLWIWMGDRARADGGTSIPEWFAPAAPDQSVWQGRHDNFLAMPVYYELINDNLHAVSHVEFVHPETLGTTVIPQMHRMTAEEQSPRLNVTQQIGDRYIHRDFHAEDIQAGPILHQMLAYQREKSE